MPKADKVSKSFGQQVRATRERKGWTQGRLVTELATLGLSMDQATVARIEKGQRGVAVDDLMVFALALGVSPLFLLLPRAIGPVELAAGVTVPGWEALAWARGMYALALTDASDTATARASEDVRFYYEACPDYEERAIRRFPLVRDLWHEVGLAMTYAADPVTLMALRDSLEHILDTAALAIAHLDATTKEK